MKFCKGSDEVVLTTEARVCCEKEMSLYRLVARRSSICGIYWLLSVLQGNVRFY